MKRILVCLILLLPAFPFAESRAVEFVKTEAMLIVLAGVSAANPDEAAVFDALAFFLIPGSSDYKTDMQRTVAYLGLGALTLYNYEAEDEGYSEKDIFAVNLVIFNIVLAGELFGFNDESNNFRDVEEPGGSFSFQLTPEGAPELNWQYRF